MDELSMEPSDLVDAVIELGNRRQRILLKMRDAVQKKDLETVFECAEQLVGLRDLAPARMPGADKKSH
jgi:hypothetical protein